MYLNDSCLSVGLDPKLLLTLLSMPQYKLIPYRSLPLNSFCFLENILKKYKLSNRSFKERLID